MANLKELNDQWREFTAARGQARQVVLDEIAENNNKVDQLRLRNSSLNAYLHSELKEEWDRKRDELKAARDNAVMDELASGKSAQKILRDMGSRNTVWIYKLRSQLVADGRLPESDNENSYTPTLKAKPTAQQKLDDQMDASMYDHVTWHTGASPDLLGWSISDDVQLVKREVRGRWFIAGAQNEFLKGDKGFYDMTGDTRITEAADKLMDMMDEQESKSA